MVRRELENMPIASGAHKKLHLGSHLHLGSVPSDAMAISGSASQARTGECQLLESDHSSTQSTDNASNSCTDTDSDDSHSDSLEQESQLAILRSKHTILATLMRDMYAILENGWIKGVQEHTGPSSGGPSKLNLKPDSSPPSRRQKRRRNDRDSTPPKDGEDGKRKSHRQSKGSGKEDRLFACPFYKNDCTKYSCNSVNGSKYRACAGPGFITIARLKYV